MWYQCKNCTYRFQEIPLIHNHSSVIARMGIACPACRKMQTVEKICPRCQSSSISPVSLTQPQKQSNT